MPPPEEEISALEEKRRALYAPEAPKASPRTTLAKAARMLPHAWKGERPIEPPQIKPHHVKLATYFFVGALTFFGLALALAAYLLYYGGETVSVNNIQIQVQGPTTVAGGDTVPLTIAITNRNPVALKGATLEADFPPGTRSADDVTKPLVTYSEDLGDVASGQSITRSVKAIVFGSSGSVVTIPVSISYGAAGSNSTFVKKYEYPISISSTPLSISADTVAETVAGKPITITLQVRSNATVPIDGVTVAAVYPFGFSLTSSSVPAAGTNFPLGKLDPGESKTITLVGTLDGQDGDTRVFHFSVGTAGAIGSGLAETYMTQDASVAITAPFIQTDLTLNGSPLSSATLSPGATESMNVSYANTLSSDLANASVSVAISGGAVDYSSVRASNGFYDSATHTILFSKDSDPALADLPPGATGQGAFTFNTVPAAEFGHDPSVTFVVSVNGTRTGESNVPEQISATKTETIKATTAVALSAQSFHASGPFANTGPIPPVVDETTGYTIIWKATDQGSAIAGGVVSATLPSYVTFTNQTNGQGSITYDSKSRVVTWSVGDLAQGASAQAAFQVSLTPAQSQRATEPALTGQASFSGFDRFASVTVTATADPVTTETTGDPGYKPDSATVK